MSQAAVNTILLLGVAACLVLLVVIGAQVNAL
jgi:hypothetical protein